MDETFEPSNGITLEVSIGIVSGVLVTIIIVLLFYCLAKGKGWLSICSSSGETANYIPCEPVYPNGNCQMQNICEDMQDPEVAQVVKKVPEIGKKTTMYNTITRNN